MTVVVQIHRLPNGQDVGNRPEPVVDGGPTEGIIVHMYREHVTHAKVVVVLYLVLDIQRAAIAFVLASEESIDLEEPDGDYVEELRTRSVYLTEAGVAKIEHMLTQEGSLQGDNLYSPENADIETQAALINKMICNVSDDQLEQCVPFFSYEMLDKIRPMVERYRAVKFVDQHADFFGGTWRR